MRGLLKRIAINGLLAAAILALVGYGLAELATIWLASNSPARPGTAAVAPDESLQSLLRTQLPLTMASWGLVFVVIAEVFLYFWRGRRKATPTKQLVEPQADPAEQLLEDILRQVETSKQGTGERGQETGETKQETGASR